MSIDRTDLIVEVLNDAFAPLMKADPHAFRVKYRKMAADPFAFYRGTACLFFADVADSGGKHTSWTRTSSATAAAASGSTATCTRRTSAPT